MHTIESRPLQTTDLVAVEEKLSQLHDSPLAAQLQVIVRQLRNGADVTYLSDQDEALTPSKAAELLQMSRPMVVELIRQGELAAFNVGTNHRIPAKEVREYIERRDKASRDVAEAFSRARGARADHIAAAAGVDPETARRLGF